MEGEEESSLDVTGDDIDLGYEERPVNRYGSPIALPESTDYEEAGPSQALPSRVVSFSEWNERVCRIFTTDLLDIND